MGDLGHKRLETVKSHMALECIADWDGVIATFAHPRYELYGSGQVFDGEDAVRKYFDRSRIPFPDQANEIISIATGSSDTVHVEFWLTGTHLGPLQVGSDTIEATGKKFRVRMAATFEFGPDTDKIICERPYFDSKAVLRALKIKT
jgi:hypothetical protein